MTAFEEFLQKHNFSTCGFAKRVGMSASQVSEYPSPHSLRMK